MRRYGDKDAEINGGMLVCPTCKDKAYSNAHAEECAEYDGVSGMSVVIRFSCEQCPDNFDLHIEQVKGNTFLYTRPAGRNLDKLRMPS
jgi:hypothetical protein